jgi:hypothetical protein
LRKTLKRKTIGITGGVAAAVVIAVFFLVMQPQNPIQQQSQNQTQIQITQNPKLGLVIWPPAERPTVNDLHDAFIQAATAGIGRSNVYISWPTIEPQQGQYNWQLYDIIMGFNREQHLNVTLYFSIINNEAFGPFPTWMGTTNLDENLANETANTLDSILSRYYIVDYVIIGGNIDSYFKDHPNDIPKYVDFFNSVYTKLKEKHPNVKLGNWFSLNNLANNYEGDMVGKLNQGDFVAYSYAPVDLTYYQNNGPDVEGQNLQKMLDYAGGKKIGLVEVGWATDKAINGTQDDQVKFMKIVFDFYRKNQSQFDFITWYRQYDRPFDTCYAGLNTNVPTGFGAQILMNNTATYLCGTGLIDVNKNPKPAWDEFKSQIGMTPNS